MDITEIKRLCRLGAVEVTHHARLRMLQRGILQEEVFSAMFDGKIIEDYPDDKPFPSSLVLGDNGLHVVCSIGDDMLYVITTYRPSKNKWESDLQTRKEVTI